MGKKTRNKMIKTLFYKCINFALSTLVAFGIVALIELHFMVPFFPILFLFDFCLLIGYPLFLVKVLKKKWFDCTKNDYLLLKYILIPWLILELLVMLYYPNETWLILQQIVKG